jgi:hypothetical protein
MRNQRDAALAAAHRPAAALLIRQTLLYLVQQQAISRTAAAACFWGNATTGRSIAATAGTVFFIKRDMLAQHTALQQDQGSSFRSTNMHLFLSCLPCPADC